MTLFESWDAVREFAGADYEAAVVPPAARALLARFDARSVHYDVLHQPTQAHLAPAPNVRYLKRMPLMHPLRLSLALAVAALTATGTAARPRPGRIPPADSVQGFVADSAGRPLAGVEVLLAELSRRTSTRAGGEFAFAGVPDGGYTLVFRRAGFAPLARHISVPRASGISVVMRPSVVQLDAVTVTATRAPADPLSSPLPAGSLGAAALAREYRVSLAHALESLAGVVPSRPAARSASR